MNKIINRTDTKVVKVGSVAIGGYNDIAIQSMTTTKTSHVKETINQINQMVKFGADLVRVAILDQDDANALKEICKSVRCPIIADIHFNYKFALQAISSGVAKIRINPGNIGSNANVLEIIDAAIKNNVAIRIGINGGSLKLDPNGDTTIQLVDCAFKWIKFFKKAKFENLVVSIKHSNPNITYKANLLLAKKCKYPIHLGVTEGGPIDSAIVKSCIGLVPLLIKGIGSTIRISMNGESKNEIKIAKLMLKNLGFNIKMYNIIACPLCGRNQFNTNKWVEEIDKYMEDKHFPISIGIMGCVVNGPGEALGCDIAVCVKSKNESWLFENGKKIKEINNNDVIESLKQLIDKKYNLFKGSYGKSN